MKEMKRIVSPSNLLIRQRDSKMDTETKDPDSEHIETGTDNNRNRLPTMEKDVVEALDTAASTNNEGKEEDSIPVELVDEEERFRRRRTPISNISISIPVPITTKIDFRPWKRMLLRQ